MLTHFAMHRVNGVAAVTAGGEMLRDGGVGPVLERSCAGAALEWLEIDHRARMIVSNDLHVRWHNRRATEALFRAVGIDLRDGELVFGTPAVQRAFATFVGALGSELHTLAVPSEDDSDVILLRGWRAQHQGESLACIEIVRDNRDFTCQYRDIDVVFRLTPAEHRIVLRSLSGQTVSSIAAALGLSLDTVRTHIRRIYSKLGVGSREELLGRLAPYRVL